MTDKELSFYFPYVIDKQHNFRAYAKDRTGFCKRYIPNYDGTNTQEFLYNKSGLTEIEIHEFEFLFEQYSRWTNWFEYGKNIFSFSEDLLYMLNKTDVNDITPHQFHLPYDIFYISLKHLNIKIAKDRSEIIEGVYVDHNYWDPNGQHPEGYCDLSFYFVGDFKNVFLEYIPNVKSRLEYLPGKYDETPIGSFWNIWLWFEKSKGRETVKQAVDHFLSELRTEIFFREDPEELITDHDLDFYNATSNLLTEAINLVINCLLYLSQPKEKMDIETAFPVGLPGNLDKKFSFARSNRDKTKVSELIEKSGFTKINYVGRSFAKEPYKENSSVHVQSHWRRGHWRNQKFGIGKQEHRLIWIMPTIVNKDIGVPAKGHIYNIANE